VIKSADLKAVSYKDEINPLTTQVILDAVKTLSVDETAQEIGKASDRYLWLKHVTGNSLALVLVFAFILTIYLSFWGFYRSCPPINSFDDLERAMSQASIFLNEIVSFNLKLFTPLITLIFGFYFGQKAKGE
jgi:hypothetical protein